MSGVDIQQLARSGATAVHLFLAWCERRRVQLVDMRRGVDKGTPSTIEGSDLDKLIAEWGREQFGASSPLLAEQKPTIVDVEIVDETATVVEKGTKKDVETIDAVASAALARVTQMPTLTVHETPSGELVLDPPAKPATAPLAPSPPLPANGRPCPVCRGSGQRPAQMMGRMMAVECEACHGSGYAPKPTVRGTACSCTSRAINPICVVHGAECICPTPYLQDPSCPLHRRAR